jgi:hypothetical protein
LSPRNAKKKIKKKTGSLLLSSSHLVLKLDVDQVRLRAVRLPEGVRAAVAEEVDAVAGLKKEKEEGKEEGSG